MNAGTPKSPGADFAAGLGHSQRLPPVPLPPQIPDHQLLRRIGGGSYGHVWLARNATGAYRAIKVVHRRSFERNRPYEREFEGIQKFEPISRLHSGFIDILHVGRNDAEGYFYYVMELADPASSPAAAAGGSEVAGGNNDNPAVGHRATECASPEEYVARTLAQDLAQNGRLPFEECVRIGVLLTDALQFLHEKGLVHRDVKPSNIIFVGGVPKLADIGLVAEAGQTLSCVGTEGFIAPEGPGSPQADLYSLGKVLYEISTGKDRHDYPEPPTDLGALTDHEGLLELNEVIFRACAAEPSRRYASARAMHRELLVVQTGRSVKRLHVLERRLAWTFRVGCGIAVLLLLAGAAYLQASHARRLATQRLIRLQVAHASRLMDEQDLSGALTWITESLHQVNGDPAAEAMHRYRFQSVWSHCPKLTAVCLHQSRINEAAFSPDGCRFVTASGDHTAQVWDAVTGAAALPALCHNSEVLHVAYSPDGKRIVTATRNAALQIWDATTGTPLCPPLQLRFHINSVAFSQDGRRLVTGSGAVFASKIYVAERVLDNGEEVHGPAPALQGLGEVQVRDAITGQLLGQPLFHAAGVEDANFSQDGRRVVAGTTDGTVVVWDTSTAQQVLTLKHTAKVRRAVYSPDGHSILTASEDYTARLWEAQTGQPLIPPLRHANRVLYATFSPDGRYIATGSRDQTACLWDAATGQLLCQPLRHESDVWYLEFSPDGRRLVTAGSESVVRIWDTLTGELLARLRQNNSATFATFSPEGRRVVAVSREPVARLWDLLPLSSTAPALPHESPVAVAQFNAESTRVLTTSTEHTARVWQPISAGPGSAYVTLLRDPRSSGIVQAAWSPDGHRVLAIGLHTNLALIFNATNGRLELSLVDSGWLTCAAYSPMGDRIATGNSDGDARIWDACTARPISDALHHDGLLHFISFSPDGRWLATSIDHGSRPGALQAQISVWDAEKGCRASPVLEIRGRLTVLCFNPDGSRLLTAAGDAPAEPQQAQLWDWRTGQAAGPPLRHLDGVVFAAFSPRGHRVATASSDRTARIWDTQTGLPLSKALLHPRQVNHVAFSPDGDRVVTAGEDGYARVWDAAASELISLPLKHDAAVRWAEFSPDGRYVVTASEDHTARIWDLCKTDRAAPDLELLAQLLSGQQIDSTGSAVPIAPDTLLKIWRALRAKYPSDFECCRREAEAWDEREAAAAEAARQRSAALFHLDRLIATHPADATYARRRAAATALLQTSAP